jgi:polyisoprenoid-binding protein YceI
MKNKTLLIVAITFFICSAFTLFMAINWQIKDKEYAIKFDTRGATGTITGLKGSINFDEKNLNQSAFDVSIDVNTINTGSNLKNKHALAEGFFNGGKYPTIKFQSIKIEKTASAYQVVGNLTIKETTKNISIPFAFENKGNEGNFKGNFTINRSDYNLKKWGVGEVVKIELVIPVKK